MPVFGFGPRIHENFTSRKIIWQKVAVWNNEALDHQEKNSYALLNMWVIKSKMNLWNCLPHFGNIILESYGKTYNFDFDWFLWSLSFCCSFTNFASRPRLLSFSIFFEFMVVVFILYSKYYNSRTLFTETFQGTEGGAKYIFYYWDHYNCY